MSAEHELQRIHKKQALEQQYEILNQKQAMLC